MVSSDEKIAIFEEILAKPHPRKMCYTCGSCQLHSLIHCKYCGDTFKGENLTLLDTIKIAHHRTVHKFGTIYKPESIAAIYRQELKEKGISHYEFEHYIREKLEETEKITGDGNGKTCESNA